MEFKKEFNFLILILVALVAIVAIVSIVILVLNSQEYSQRSVISGNASIIDNCVIETDSSITGQSVVSCPNFEVIGGTVVRR